MSWTREVLQSGPVFYIGWVRKERNDETSYQQLRPDDGIYYAERAEAEARLEQLREGRK